MFKPYKETDDYRIVLEDEQGNLFVHFVAYAWNKSIREEALSEWSKLKDKALSAGYDKIHTYTHNPKFCILLGGTKTFEFRDYEVFTWALK